MKCALHADQNCVEACHGCGRLICESCDVFYAGQHFCKPCVGKIATPMPRTDRRERPWLLKTIDRLMVRWYATGLIGFGIFLMITGFVAVEVADPHCSSYLLVHVSQSSLSTSYASLPAISKSYLSIWLQSGAALALLGAYLLVKRFSLRWLLAGVCCIAAIGAYPFARIHGNPQRCHAIDVGGSRPLTAQDIARIRTLLDPATAMRTLPAGLLKELELKPGEGLKSVTVSASKKNGVHCLLEFSADVTDVQRSTLEAFYSRYLVDLLSPTHISLPQVGTSLWPKYETEWENTRAASKANGF